GRALPPSRSWPPRSIGRWGPRVEASRLRQTRSLLPKAGFRRKPDGIPSLTAHTRQRATGQNRRPLAERAVYDLVCWLKAKKTCSQSILASEPSTLRSTFVLVGLSARKNKSYAPRTRTPLRGSPRSRPVILLLSSRARPVREKELFRGLERIVGS